jgi:hypothetical protein
MKFVSLFLPPDVLKVGLGEVPLDFALRWSRVGGWVGVEVGSMSKSHKSLEFDSF